MRTIQKVYIIITLVLAAVWISACEALPGSEPEALKASGVVEVTEVSIAAELSGRVAEVNVTKGARVEKGDALFRIEGELVAAQLTQARAGLESARAQLSTAEEGLTAAEKALEMAEINNVIAQLQFEVQRSSALQNSAAVSAQEWSRQPPERFDQPGWYYPHAQEIEGLQVAVENAQDQLQAAHQELNELIDELGGDELRKMEQDIIEAQAEYLVAQELYFRPVDAEEDAALRDEVRDQYEAARDALEDAQGELDRQLDQEDEDDLRAARARVSVSHETYLLTLFNYYRALSGESSLGVQIAQKQLDQAAVAVEQAEAGRQQAAALVIQAENAVAQAEANLAMVEMQEDRLVVKAPVSGTVLTSSVDSGEVVQPGAPVMTIGIMDKMYITVYLSENQYGLVSIGDQADVEVDSFPDEVFSAEVVRIADQAEFTPRNVQTEEERQTTVYAIELNVLSGADELKPGMPADVLFDVKGAE